MDDDKLNSLFNRAEKKEKNLTWEDIPMDSALNRKWMTLWKRAMRGDRQAQAAMKWIGDEARQCIKTPHNPRNRNFNDPRQFNIDEWLE